MDKSDEDLFNDADAETSTGLKNAKKRRMAVSTLTIQKRKRTQKNFKEKLKLAELMSKESVIWDFQHQHHFNSYTLAAAWNRIASGMEPPTTVDQCKTWWKSLRDGNRYRRKTAMRGKSADSGDDELNDGGKEANWPFQDAIAFLRPTASNHPRKTIASEICQYSGSPNISLDDDISCKSPETVSNKSYATKDPFLKDQKDEGVVAMMGLSSAIDKLVNVVAMQTAPVPKPAPEAQQRTMKYECVWQLLENLYAKMKPEDIDTVNQQAIASAYAFIKKNP